ncbi:hypothetical protein [Labrys neptuniae]
MKSWLTFGWLKGWRTIALNGLLIAAAVVDYLNSSTLGSVLPPNYAWVPIVIGVANILMRAATNTAMGKKE